MTTDFLHGIETYESTIGGALLRTVKSAVVLLVGTAPVHKIIPDGMTDDEWYAQTVNKPLLITNPKDAAYYFGNATIYENLTPDTHDYKEYTIPQALEAIFAHKKGGTVICVNVFDPATHIEAAGESQGPDVSKVDADDIIGAVDGSGVRTGLQFIAECYSRFGFRARQILCPKWCESATVMASMISLGTQYRAFALIDATAGLSPQAAITARGTGGAYNTSSKRAILCYPRFKIDEELEPFSQRMAGVIIATHNDFGFWYSPSNKIVQGVTGVERHLSCSLDDPDSEVNLLNAAGWVTYYNDYATGFRTFGNRSAAWPTSTDPSNFIAFQWIRDMVAESLEYATLQYLDLPINIVSDAVLVMAQAYLNSLISRGALLGGTIEFLKQDNSDAAMAAGQLTFHVELMGPTPAERITYNQVVNINMIQNIFTSSNN